MTPFYQYVEDVLGDKIVVGKLIKLAVERFVSDCDKKDYEFRYEEGERLVKFSEGFCRHWKGPKQGAPIALEPHQMFYWIQKYGWINPNTGLPRFRRSVKMIARKQYKTTEVAIESLFHMLKGIDQPAQVFTCATKEDDAVVVVNDAGRIAEVSPKLKKRFKLSIHEPYVRRVICDNGSFMTYMTKGHDAVDISFGIGDECHDWPDASIKNRIESAMGNRMCPVFSTITTAGFDKLGYCFGTLRDTSIKILNKDLEDDEQLILIFELDEGDDWKNPENWVKPNPNLPYSKTHLPYLQSEFKKAVNEGGSTEVNFKTKNLNLWVDAPQTFIASEIWHANTRGLDPETLNGEICYGGLEIGPSGSISALCLLFPGEVIKIKMMFFISEEAVKQNEFYGKNAEYLRIDPGNEVENDVAIRWIQEEISKYNMDSFCFPNEQKNNSIVQGVIKLGYVGNPISQAVGGISNATSEWEKELKGNKIEHFNNPILTWMNSNCTVIRKEKGIRVEKSPRVLGIYACLNAWSQWKTIEANGVEVKTDFLEL
jgi:phage terminase large subunit-like protein